MAKLIQAIPLVKLTEIKQLCPDETSNGKPWSRRLEFLNFEGVLFLFVSENKHPGEHFVRMCRLLPVPEDAPIQLPPVPFEEFHTSCGKYDITGDELRMTTRNSFYRFHILDNSMTKENQDKIEFYFQLFAR